MYTKCQDDFMTTHVVAPMRDLAHDLGMTRDSMKPATQPEASDGAQEAERESDSIMQCRGNG